jgi:hypothetical protein
MLRLQDNKTKLIVNIEGYAYPFSREYWDANWLSIEVIIYEKGDLFFNKNDTCLLTTELINLKDWFENIAKNNFGLTTNSIQFTEPCISFQVNLNKLKIILRYNLNPLYEQDYDSTYVLEFEINTSIVSNLIASVGNYIEKYSERNS